MIVSGCRKPLWDSVSSVVNCVFRNNNAKLLPPASGMSPFVPVCRHLGPFDSICRYFLPFLCSNTWFCNYFLLSLSISSIPIHMFTIRTYAKSDLALLYNPHVSRKSALKTLQRWINGCAPLVKELEELQYQPRRHSFLPPEVKAIVRHLGEP